MIVGYDHVQVAIPAGAEPDARAFYGDLLGLSELTKPPVLAARGGCWFAGGSAVLHLGVEVPFAPARKSHPALLVSDLAGLATLLGDAGYEVVPSADIPGVERFHTFDPFGNRLEFQQEV